MQWALTSTREVDFPVFTQNYIDLWYNSVCKDLDCLTIPLDLTSLDDIMLIKVKKLK